MVNHKVLTEFYQILSQLNEQEAPRAGLEKKFRNLHTQNISAYPDDDSDIGRILRSFESEEEDIDLNYVGDDEDEDDDTKDYFDSRNDDAVAN